MSSLGRVALWPSTIAHGEAWTRLVGLCAPRTLPTFDEVEDLARRGADDPDAQEWSTEFLIPRINASVGSIVRYSRTGVRSLAGAPMGLAVQPLKNWYGSTLAGPVIDMLERGPGVFRRCVATTSDEVRAPDEAWFVFQGTAAEFVFDVFRIVARWLGMDSEVVWRESPSELTEFVRSAARRARTSSRTGPFDPDHVQAIENLIRIVSDLALSYRTPEDAVRRAIASISLGPIASGSLGQSGSYLFHSAGGLLFEAYGALAHSLEPSRTAGAADFS